jgi:hypothetical protein
MEPESATQAATWQTTTTRYIALGLCPRCAAQAAYGHQLGFSRVEPPCADCLSVVEGFDMEKPNGWRKASRERLRNALTGALSPTRGVSGAEE